MSLFIQMGSNKSIYKREAYTVLNLIGDFGGFTDALALIFGLLVSFYSAYMFKATIAEEIPHSSSFKDSFSLSGIQSENYSSNNWQESIDSLKGRIQEG